MKTFAFLLLCATACSSAPNQTGPDAGSNDLDSYCVSKCVSHESGCGVASPRADCQSLCTQYNPFRSQVDCASQVACGNQPGLFACLPDLTCVQKCVAHENACGDPHPENGCQQICSQYRPTPAQVACAQGVSCGDVGGLVTCIQGNHD